MRRCDDYHWYDAAVPKAVRNLAGLSILADDEVWKRVNEKLLF